MSRRDETTFLGAYWGPRRESAEQCADRLLRCITSLAEISPLLSTWKQKTRTKREAMLAATIDLDDLVRQVGAGVNRRDSDRSIIEELGYSWAAWNGNMKSAVSLSVSCGSWSEVLKSPNSLVLNLPEPSCPDADTIYGNAEQILGSVVEAWEPDRALISSHRLREEVESISPNAGMTVGWKTYLGPSLNPKSELGENFGQGRLVKAAENWAEVESADVIRVAKQLRF